MILEKIFGQILHRNRLSQKHVFALFSFIFILWAFYRYFPEILPVWVEELILKPLIWLIPTFWLVRRIEKKPFSSLGLTRKNLSFSLFWGIGLGIVFALEGLLVNLLKYRGLELVSFNQTPLVFLGSVALSFATAFSEETVFRGYIFNRLWKIWKNEWLASFVSAFLFALIYLPIGVFVLGYKPLVMSIYVGLIFIYGLASAFIFARTGNLLSSILIHVFWNWPIVLFR